MSWKQFLSQKCQNNLCIMSAESRESKLYKCKLWNEYKFSFYIQYISIKFMRETTYTRAETESIMDNFITRNAWVTITCKIILFCHFNINFSKCNTRHVMCKYYISVMQCEDLVHGYDAHPHPALMWLHAGHKWPGVTLGIVHFNCGQVLHTIVPDISSLIN